MGNAFVLKTKIDCVSLALILCTVRAYKEKEKGKMWEKDVGGWREREKEGKIEKRNKEERKEGKKEEGKEEGDRGGKEEGNFYCTPTMYQS